MLSFNKLLRKSISALGGRGRYLPLIILGVLSLAIHFTLIGHPNSAVFDEVHFGKFISAYFTHEYYFDIHPPLGKLILAGWGKLWGFQPGFSFANIGDEYPDNLYIALRFLPALAGALLPLVIYGIARQLNMRRWSALLAAIFVLLDNALLVQSRLILLDSFLLLFGFGAILCYLTWRNRGGKGYSKWYLVSAGLLTGGAMSIKWTGGTFLALIVILELIHLWKDRHGTARQRLWVIVTTLIVLPLAVYISAFSVHFALLKKSGVGDAFMSQQFRNGTLSFPEKFIELNKQMYLSNQRLTATHPYSSPWYSWPLMVRPIFYWVQGISRIYLLGNPVVWWVSSGALIMAAVGILMGGIRSAPRIPLILLGAWLMNLLPFIGIGRVMFLYHYFTALIWAILVLAWVVDRVHNPRRTTLVLSALALGAFIWFAPLSYGMPLSDAAYAARTWIASWR